MNRFYRDWLKAYICPQSCITWNREIVALGFHSNIELPQMHISFHKINTV